MVFSFLSIGVLLVVVVLIVLIGTGLKAQTEDGGKDMIKNVYIYLVLFATLMMTIGGTVAAFMAVADIVAPVPYHQSFEDFKRFDMKDPRIGTDTTNQENNLSEEELRQQYDAMVLMESERQLNRAKNSLIKSFGWIVIPLPVFLYFQSRRLGNKEI